MFAISGPGFLLFVAVLLAVWYAVPQRWRWLVMLAASVVFYLSLAGAGFAVLLVAAAVVWLAARHAQTSRAWLYLGLAAALAPLLAVKLVGLLGIQPTAMAPPVQAGFALLQTLGLAYFGLQLAGYLLDVRAGRLAPEPAFARVLCYAAFFLSITQGPFNRYADLMPQLDAAPDYAANRLWRGAMRTAWGYYKKLAIAERLAIVVDTVFACPAAFDASQLAFAALAFTLQLYADFSGYTDIVLGIGEMLGLALPENFRQPFLACTIKEFWARWHISLSRWFRDYVYIPLGGSRRGTLRRDANVVLTMLVSGLWHGASLTFLLWGAGHGAIQAVENHLPNSKTQPRPLRALRGCCTFAFVVLLFTVFRTESFAETAAYFAAMLQNRSARVFSCYWEIGLTSRLELLLLLAGPILLFAVDLLHERGVCLRDWLAARCLPVRWAVYQVAIFAFLLCGQFLTGAGGSFLYQKF